MASSYTLADLRRAAETLWPVATAESWDRVGLATGRDETPLRRVLLAVDAVSATVEESLDWKADVLLTHHPLLLRGVHTIAEDTGKGALLARLIRGECALLSAHTNADQPEGGVSDAIARKLGLEGIGAIVPADGPTSVFGIGRIGELPEAISLKDLADRLAEIMPQTVTGIRVAGDPSRMVLKVALLGGAGDSLLDHPLVRDADAYITSDLRHHPAQESLEHSLVAGGPALIDVAHWASESLWLDDAADTLSELLPGVEFRVSRLNTDPWSFAVGSAH